MKRIVATFAALLAAGCAGMATQPTNQRLALYRAHAGAAVPSISYLGTINGWEPLGDRALVLWTRPNEAYLLDLYGPCNDLDITQKIDVTRRAARVYAGFDEVLVLNDNRANSPCRIQRISPVDIAGFRSAERGQASSGT